MLKPAISGRLRAAAMNLFRLAARNGTSLPARSSRTNVNPPDVPTPGIAGGEKSEGDPFGKLAQLRIQVLLDRLKLFVLLRLRSPQSFSVTKKKPL